MKYTVGFLFQDSPELDSVLLIHKLRGPPYVVGKLNGIGGKFKEGETPLECMIREGEEEANVLVKSPSADWLQEQNDSFVDWQQFHYELHPGKEANPEPKELYFFVATTPVNTSSVVRSLTDEVVSWVHLSSALRSGKAPVVPVNQAVRAGPVRSLVPNLMYLLPMAKHWLENKDQHYSTQEPCKGCF